MVFIFLFINSLKFSACRTSAGIPARIARFPSQPRPFSCAVVPQVQCSAKFHSFFNKFSTLLLHNNAKAETREREVSGRDRDWDWDWDRDRGCGTSYHKLKYQQRRRRQRPVPHALPQFCAYSLTFLFFVKGNQSSAAQWNIDESERFLHKLINTNKIYN